MFPGSCWAFTSEGPGLGPLGPMGNPALDFSEAFDGDDDDFGDDDDAPRRITLLPHFRCAAHTLNLLASSDLDRVLIYHQSYDKKVFSIAACNT